MQWLFIFISRVLSNPAAAFGESPGFDGSACVVASRQLPFAVASWFLVSGAVPVTSLATAGAAPGGGPARARCSRPRPSRCHSLLFSPLHVRACPPARAPCTDAADATRLTAAPSCTPRSGPGSEALAVPSRYVRPRHPLAPPPGIPILCAVRVREGRDRAWDGMKWLRGANTQSEPRGNRC